MENELNRGYVLGLLDYHIIRAREVKDANRITIQALSQAGVELDEFDAVAAEHLPSYDLYDLRREYKNELAEEDS